MRQTTQQHTRRLTDIRESSGRHAAEAGQISGGGYLTDMQGFALPLIFVMIVLMVSAFKIMLPDPFPFPLTMIGLVSALGAIATTIFLTYVSIRRAQTVDYIDVQKLKRASICLHIAELVLTVTWLNWLIEIVPGSVSITGPIAFLAIIATLALRIRRSSLTRRRHLWER